MDFYFSARFLIKLTGSCIAGKRSFFVVTRSFRVRRMVRDLVVGCLENSSVTVGIRTRTYVIFLTGSEGKTSYYSNQSNSFHSVSFYFYLKYALAKDPSEKLGIVSQNLLKHLNPKASEKEKAREIPRLTLLNSR